MTVPVPPGLPGFFWKEQGQHGCCSLEQGWISRGWIAGGWYCYVLSADANYVNTFITSWECTPDLLLCLLLLQAGWAWKVEINDFRPSLSHGVSNSQLPVGLWGAILVSTGVSLAEPMQSVGSSRDSHPLRVSQQSWQVCGTGAAKGLFWSHVSAEVWLVPPRKKCHLDWNVRVVASDTIFCHSLREVRLFIHRRTTI